MSLDDLFALSADEATDLVTWLPAGCAFWLSVGGPASLTAEATLLRTVVYRLEVLAWQKTKDATSGKNRPKPPDSPAWAHERAAEDRVMGRKAAAYMTRQRRRQ